MRRAAAGLLVAVIALGAAGCGSSKPSPQDTAKSNGEAVGKAIKQLTSATSLSDVESAVADLQTALKNVQKNVKDSGGQLESQINHEKQTLTKAFGDVKSAASSGAISDLSNAIGVLQTDLTNLGQDAKSMASTTDSVAKAFWQGVQQGYNKG